VEIGGSDLVITGNIPLGGGLSSSASLEMVLAFAWLEQSGIELPANELAKICQRAESEFVGVSCGIMDQFIIEQGRCNQAMVLACDSLDFKLADMPERAVFLLVHSGVNRELRTGSYNARRQECEQAVSCLRAARPGLSQLCELNIDELQMNAGLLDTTLFRRARHVITENSRVREAAAALEQADLVRLGQLISLSHDSLRDDFEVSCPELDHLVKLLGSCEGVLGARMMGAGFGGCTISLVERDKVASMAQQIKSEYGKTLGADPWLHIVGPADTIQRLD
jgi:galactokinase